MTETTITQQQETTTTGGVSGQETQEVQKTNEQTQQAKEVDLVTRVSQVKVEPKVEVRPEEGKFNINELDTQIEKITDTDLKQQFVEFKKSLLRGENQKYQEIANLRKQYEQKLAETTNWTPERVKQEMNKPDFVQSAQRVLQEQAPTGSGMTNEQWSALSDKDKAEFAQMKQKIDTLERTNWEAIRMQQDTSLKTKYANYDPQTIDRLAIDLVQGKIQATREDLWKVYDYENAVQRAYELGLQDKVNLNKERVSGMTFEGGTNMPQPTKLDRQKGETVQQFMLRSYQEHSKKK